MIWLVFAAHGLGLVAAAIAGRTGIRAALRVAAVAPALTALWALTQIAGPSNDVYEVVWVERLDIALRFRLDSLAMVMTAIVSGIGALVFVYAAGYFDPTAAGAVRFPMSLLGFSTAMLGLVLADSIWTLFIFWELTSVTSFLLVGHKNTDPGVQAAARRALMITGGGGLALLTGLMVLAQQAGTTSLTNLTALSGTSGTVAALLVLAGVATKSAQVPFHVWLPGAMAAPTPVSAYLHSATMVKAGIILMAVTSPAFIDIAAWQTIGIALGITSMLWGGVGALRHRDAKLILAWGTISQLGLLVTLLAAGSAKATFAAIAIVVAHALFKATLFLVVGEIDIRTGTRDINQLGDLYRTMPVATVAAVLAGLSMAGAPPLLGFVAKEAALEAALGLSGATQTLLVVAISVGSVLTVAYTVRFLWCTFGPGPRTEVSSARIEMTAPSVVLAGAGLVAFFTLGWVNPIIAATAAEIDPKADVYRLLAWPGFTTAFILSMAILAVGTIVGAAASRRTHNAPDPRGADLTDAGLDQTLTLAKHVTARVQHGSLPVYLTTMAAVATVAAAIFATALSVDHLSWWDHPLQLVLALAISIAAIAGATVTSRLGAALTLGAVGIAMSGLFVVHGAPDLALTQLLIETIVVVGFVVGLGRLTAEFPSVGDAWRNIRIAMSLAGGAAVTLALAASGANPTGTPPLADLARESVDTGGGNNIVNVILTDMRALDTLGEVVVLAAVAIGILALARPQQQHQTPNNSSPNDEPANQTHQPNFQTAATVSGAVHPDTASPNHGEPVEVTR